MKYRSNRTPVGQGVFLLMDEAKQKARNVGLDVIDLSIGASDLSPDPEVIEVLGRAIQSPETYGYSLKTGTLPFLQAATHWYQTRFGIQLDPSKQALSLIGAQEGLAHLLFAVADPGDVILMPEIAYPSYFGAAKVAGLEPFLLALDDQYLPDFSTIPTEILKRAKVLLLNYPNNPTAAIADQGLFKQAIELCLQHEILLIHDNPYLDQSLEPTVSPLSLPRATECCVELFSFSKSFHLAGFRLGFALGNPYAIAALEAVKAPIDFNQYVGIQQMGIAALQIPKDRLTHDAQIWQSRQNLMVRALGDVGWNIELPKAAMYLWAQLPEKIQMNDLDFCLKLAERTGVCLSPGRGFGEAGTGFVRFALVEREERLLEASVRIGKFIN